MPGIRCLNNTVKSIQKVFYTLPQQIFSFALVINFTITRIIGSYTWYKRSKSWAPNSLKVMHCTWMQRKTTSNFNSKESWEIWWRRKSCLIVKILGKFWDFYCRDILTIKLFMAQTLILGHILSVYDVKCDQKVEYGTIKSSIVKFLHCKDIFLIP